MTRHTIVLALTAWSGGLVGLAVGTENPWLLLVMAPFAFASGYLDAKDSE